MFAREYNSFNRDKDQELRFCGLVEVPTLLESEAESTFKELPKITKYTNNSTHPA